jgi:mono/diheme cytochrome c family protein
MTRVFAPTQTHPQRRRIVNRANRMWAFGLLAVSLTLPALAQTNGAETFKSKCAMCHGPDGLATTSMATMLKVPSFKSPDLVKAPDSQLIDATKNGKGKMPAYNGKLTDAQIKEVVAYIRTLQK